MAAEEPPRTDRGRAGAVYIASYHAQDGRWSCTTASSTADPDPGPLQTTADAQGNGVYRYGAPAASPAARATATTTGSTSCSRIRLGPHGRPRPGAWTRLCCADRPFRATFDEQVQPSTIVFALHNGATVVPSSFTYDAATRTATLTPSSPLARTASTPPSVQASDTSGNPMAAPTTWSFRTAVDPGGLPATLWDTSAAPAVASANDGSAVELGVRFIPERAGRSPGFASTRGRATRGRTSDASGPLPGSCSVGGVRQ